MINKILIQLTELCNANNLNIEGFDVIPNQDHTEYRLVMVKNNRTTACSDGTVNGRKEV